MGCSIVSFMRFECQIDIILLFLDKIDRKFNLFEALTAIRMKFVALL
jgi:hypothetical protein